MPKFRPLANNLETARLRMRPWTPADSTSIRRLWEERDPRALRRIDSDGRPTVEEFRTNIENQLAESALNGLELLAIETKHDGEFIGYCGLVVGNSTLDEPEIAYELFKHAHGNGYATEASRAVLSAAQDTGRTRLWATVRAWNLASFRVLEKVGFVDSGKVDPDPVRGDSVWMTWPALPSGHN
ncbi:GCN5 family acetyltransferase [Arthrobacter sp. ERGS1:01]|uniref:GNAT family N-acetyltransferase n=1 Tax=Arthrobacter sp. ERGS1:01 TaxID=1704044 RepID=UPI0006B69116|nr:GNAT family N-acetyltransferase [Arthrobacter sp. ERGS1:01]ALE06856.1 GCN5 family acetyltransferase [Arthrobacter sp. ERGS1:01]